MKATTVIDYIVQRIADEGVQHCFGVPGDYAFPVGDAVDNNPNIKWIGCSNELNASYAADGYARARGAAMLSTTPRRSAPPHFNSQAGSNCGNAKEGFRYAGPGARRSARRLPRQWPPV